MYYGFQKHYKIVHVILLYSDLCYLCPLEI